MFIEPKYMRNLITISRSTETDIDDLQSAFEDLEGLDPHKRITLILSAATQAQFSEHDFFELLELMK